MYSSTSTLPQRTLRPFAGRALSFIPATRDENRVTKTVRSMRARISRRRVRQATRTLMSRISL